MGMSLLSAGGSQWHLLTGYAKRATLPPPQFANYSMSSLTWKESFSQGGIFEDNPKKSPLAGANRVFVTYCSSDSWIGDGENYGFQFRGARIVSAVLASLVSVHGMGNAGPGEKLVFGGCSAGGRGAMYNLDYIPGILAGLGATEVTTVGLMDAALWIDIDPMLPSITSQQCQTAAMANMSNATARMGATCLAAYPGIESWKCLYGQYRAPFVVTPYLLQASQDDVFQIEININAGGAKLPPSTPADFAFAAEIQSACRAVVETLPTSSQRDSGIFSPSCFHHCVTDAEARRDLAFCLPFSRLRSRAPAPARRSGAWKSAGSRSVTFLWIGSRMASPLSTSWTRAAAWSAAPAALTTVPRVGSENPDTASTLLPRRRLLQPPRLQRLGRCRRRPRQPKIRGAGPLPRRRPKTRLRPSALRLAWFRQPCRRQRLR